MNRDIPAARRYFRLPVRGFAPLLAAAAALCLLLASGTVHAIDATAARFQESYDLEGKRAYSKALRALQQVGEPARSGYVFAVRMAWLSYLARRSGDALRWYARAAKLVPSSVEAPLGRILVLNASRRWARAAKEAVALLKRYPNERTTLSRLAWALFNQGRFADARGRYEQVLAMYPADIEMRTGLGWCLLRMGKPGDAAKAFARVLRVAPRHRSARDGALRAQAAGGHAASGANRAAR